ncbi:MAG: DUF1573 domain-containing protein [Phycisphaerales bacterium]|nr:DUF1573 domain-containing protein [Phycisphaerales bacterium]
MRILFLAAVGILFMDSARIERRAFQEPVKRSAKLEVEKASIELGEVLDGDKVPLEYRLRNIGDGDLIIGQVSPDCGCTVVELTEQDRLVRPGESRLLKLTFDSTGRATDVVQKKTIRVETNDPAKQQVTLDFSVVVKSLFRLSPSGSFHLQALRRGDESRRPLDVFPGSHGKDVHILSADIPAALPLSKRQEAITEKGVKGTRLTFRANEDAPLGPAEAPLTLKLEVDGQTIERKVTLQVTIVGDIEFRPTIINLVNQRTAPGRKLAPITLTSTTRRPLKVLKAEGGPVLELEVRPGTRADQTEQVVQPVIRGDAPTGPFAAMVRITTDSIDQPVVRIPVYGHVSAPVEIEPDLVILRDDGSVVGASRFVRLLYTRTGGEFHVKNVESSLSLVAAKRGAEPGEDQPQVENLVVYLLGEAPAGVQRGTLTIETTLPESPTLTLPFVVLSKSADLAEVLGKE